MMGDVRSRSEGVSRLFVLRVVSAAVVAAMALMAAVSCAGGGATSSTRAALTTSPSAGPSSTAVGGESTAGEAEQQARDFVGLLASGSFAEAETRMDDTMRAALPQQKLAEVWQAVESQVGMFRRVEATRVEQTDGYTVVYVTTEFGPQTLDVKVVYDTAGRVAGLFFVPTATGATGTTTSYQAPPYVVADAFTEQDVTVGAGTWALPATLSLPKRSGPFPAVVLVHGSGPQDRDESIGPNKPFRDLAGGLASRGVAVLRYEKRTKVYAPQMVGSAGRITTKEETVDDAVEAVRLMKQRADIDPRRVFVLGHSLGGTLAPRIAAASSDVAGLVVLAGAARPLEDVILEQTTYLLGLQSGISEAERTTQIDEVRGQVATVEDPSLSVDTPASDLPLGIPAAYWLDLRGYDPPAAAAGLAKPVPVLVLQGGRDYQVTTEDYELWLSALGGHAGADFKLYPDLNHLFDICMIRKDCLEGAHPARLPARTIYETQRPWLVRNVRRNRQVLPSGLLSNLSFLGPM